jgi:hypothetical protein
MSMKQSNASSNNEEIRIQPRKRLRIRGRRTRRAAACVLRILLPSADSRAFAEAELTGLAARGVACSSTALTTCWVAVTLRVGPNGLT